MARKRNAAYTQIGFVTMRCEERETLIQAYLNAVKNSRRVSDSVKYIYSLEWLLETEQKRQTCESALAALKLHIREHNC